MLRAAGEVGEVVRRCEVGCCGSIGELDILDHVGSIGVHIRRVLPIFSVTPTLSESLRFLKSVPSCLGCSILPDLCQLDEAEECYKDAKSFEWIEHLFCDE